ncbi:MAG: GAF domain-containing protein [Deltaproteobacteria bacterium]|nr:GAF domain-containing protein [Deltaproteobacteria bacterium]MBZ0219828.1 GAF domain-containing protein [Deltaproteobacteria bacterium]
MSIKARLIIIFLAFSLIPAVFIGLLLLENGRRYIERNTLSTLGSIAVVKKAQLLEFLQTKKERVEIFASDSIIAGTLASMRGMGTAEISREGRSLGEYLNAEKRPLDEEIIEIHLFDLSGRVVASTDPGFIGRDESEEPYFRTGLQKSNIQDASLHYHAGRPHYYIPVSAPVRSGGEVVGVLMNGYSITLADELVTGERLERLGDEPSEIESRAGVDIFIVNQEGLLLTSSRKAPEIAPLSERVSSFPVEECLARSNDAFGMWVDKIGKNVWGASECMNIQDGPRWALVVEQDESYAVAPLKYVNYIILLVGLSVAVVAIFISYSTALAITRPIDELRKGAEEFATGNLDYRVGIAGRDELAALSRSFDKMAGDLKKVTASRDELARETAERIRAIEALRLSETKYRNLVDTSLAGIFRSNFEGDLLFANAALARIFDFDSAEEMMREGSLQRYRDPAAREEFLKMLSETGSVEALEVEMLTRTGEAKTILMSATVLRDVISGTMLDITELKRAEEVRREAEGSRALSELSDAMANVVTDYQGVLDTIAKYIGDLMRVPCIIRLLSADGKWLEPVAVYHVEKGLREELKEFIAANPQRSDKGVGGRVVSEGRQLSFGSPEEIWKTIRPEYRTVMERLGITSALVTPLRSEGRVIGLIACFRPKKGESFTPTEMLLLQDLADRAALAISIARLFRETRSYAKELERSNAELQNFAYIVSHDLKEPLRMIDGYLRLIERKYAGSLDEEARKRIAFASSGAVRMQRIIDDLLEYSRVTTQARPFEPVDTGKVLEEVLENLTVAIRESRAVIDKGELPRVMADPVQLSQVFQNLLANAMKFRDKTRRPEIRVFAVEGENEWVFTVADNGIGIDPAHLDKVFDLFQRLHGPEYPGTGLGLAISKKVVERHEGRIWVESEPGAGSSFHFTIPKAAFPGEGEGGSAL